MSANELGSICMPTETFDLLWLIRGLNAEGGLNTASLVIPQDNQTLLIANQDLKKRKMITQVCSIYMYNIG